MTANLKTKHSVNPRWHQRVHWRWLCCALGAGAAVALALACVAPPASPWLLASLGSSAAFVFCLTRAAAAQPRALLGGHLLSAAVGIGCQQLFGDALWVYGLAATLAVGLMLATATLHPPAGANPVIMIHGHAGWSALWQPVAVAVLCIIAVAWLWSRLYPGLARYPSQLLARSPAPGDSGAWGA